MSSEETPAAPRQTLAMRLAERERQRALRAERLARLRPAAEAPAPAPEADAEAADADAERAGGARGLPARARRRRARGCGGPGSRDGPRSRGAGRRPALPAARAGADPAAGGLERLPGAGPGLVWALERAGLGTLADIAALAPETLADRLGPIGRLVPAGAWIAAARAAVPAGDPVL